MTLNDETVNLCKFILSNFVFLPKLGHFYGLLDSILGIKYELQFMPFIEIINIDQTQILVCNCLQQVSVCLGSVKSVRRVLLNFG